MFFCREVSLLFDVDLCISDEPLPVRHLEQFGDESSCPSFGRHSCRRIGQVGALMLDEESWDSAFHHGVPSQSVLECRHPFQS